MITKEDSEHYDTFSDEEKKQFLYVVFQHLVIGGQMTQPDEMIENYVEIAKILYKSLVWYVFNLQRQKGLRHQQRLHRLLCVQDQQY